jgi:hypothetical protein
MNTSTSPAPRSAKALAVVVACLLPMAGCGSGTTTTPSTAASVTVGNQTGPAPATTATAPSAQTIATYISEADGVCREADAELVELSAQERQVGREHLTPQHETERLAPLWEKAAAVFRLVNERDRKLRAPSGERASLARIAAGHEQQAKAAERRASSLRHYQPLRYNALVKQIEQEEARFFAVEKEYGFQVCGSSGTRQAGYGA